MVNPLASCITPTFGRSHLIHEMYWCWNNQSYPNKELIIVNDEKNVILTTQDSRVKIFNFDERFVGLGAKRNFCLQQISPEAEIVFPFDDDDLFFPDHIDSLVRGFIENPEVDIAKNRRHFIAKNNSYENLMEGTWPFFGASAFSAKKMRSLKFEDTYITGEDVNFIDKHALSKVFVSHKYPTFIYRLGMGIVHASGHKVNSSNPDEQKRIYDKIGQSINPRNEPIEVKLEAKMSYAANSLYKELISRRTWV